MLQSFPYYLEKGNIDPVLLERMFRKALYALEKHALYLCDQAGIDYPVNLYQEAPIPRILPLVAESATGDPIFLILLATGRLEVLIRESPKPEDFELAFTRWMGR